MKLEFIIGGSPTDASWSRVAMFRRSLDNLGGEYCAARLVFRCSASGSVQPPDRWKPYFRNIEVIEWKSEYCYDGGGRFPANLGDRLFNGEADLTFLCDVDTLLLRPFPVAFLAELLESPAISGVIAYYPPSLTHLGPTVIHQGTSPFRFWSMIARYTLGRTIGLQNCYTLLREIEPCPFYIDYGFVGLTPKLLRKLDAHLQVVEPRILRILNNECYRQIGVALAVERAALPTRVLPLRFNFPTDAIADQFYPKELDNIVLLHYQRTDVFDGHRIFNEPAEFDKFLSSRLSGSNMVFRDYIHTVTGGQFPFY